MARGPTCQGERTGARATTSRRATNTRMQRNCPARPVPLAPRVGAALMQPPLAGQHCRLGDAARPSVTTGSLRHQSNLRLGCDAERTGDLELCATVKELLNQD